MKPPERDEASIKVIRDAADGAVTYLLQHLVIPVAERAEAGSEIEVAVITAIYAVLYERGKRLTPNKN